MCSHKCLLFPDAPFSELCNIFRVVARNLLIEYCFLAAPSCTLPNVQHITPQVVAQKVAMYRRSTGHNLTLLLLGSISVSANFVLRKTIHFIAVELVCCANRWLTRCSRPSRSWRRIPGGITGRRCWRGQTVFTLRHCEKSRNSIAHALGKPSSCFPEYHQSCTFGPS